MSFVLTYNTLVARVISDLERDDSSVTDNMDSWIKFAHERIARDSDTLLFEVVLNSNFVPNQFVLQKPNRWQNTVSFNYGTGVGFNTSNNLLQRTYEFCRDYWPDATQVATPYFYADYTYQNFYISPTPDQAYPYELIYLETPQVIDINFQTNYLTQFMPEILIRAVLLEAMLTMKNDERAALIEDSYAKLIASWNNKDTLRKTDRYTTRKAD